MARVFFIFCLIFFSCTKKETHASKQTVRISLSEEPTSLDPRKARDLNSGIILRMLFEGLFRISNTGVVEPAIALSFEVSEDGLTYVFHLQNTKWSDGSLLTARDFICAWKQILDPNFPTDVAYYLYPIKNARKAKLGEVPLDAVGVHMQDPLTLVVELEQPTPYFLQLLTMPSFFAIPAASDSLWALEAKALISNGPFRMKSWAHADQIVLEKNPLYWDAAHVQLDEVDLIVASADTALRCFEEGTMDWTGSPLATMPADAVRKLHAEEKLQSSPFLASSFFRVNVQSLPNVHFRRSLALAIDRKAITQHVLQGGQVASFSLVPLEMGLSEEGYFLDHQQDAAVQLLAQAKEDGPLAPIVMSYLNNERNATLAQAIQKQWQEHLGIDVTLEAVEPKVFFQRIKQKDYQIALGSWTADFNDPINFLEVFKYKDNGTNNTGWESAEYIDLLNRSAVCRDLEERKQCLMQAEAILMEEMPIIPIYQSAMNYLKQEALQGVYLSPQGQLDLRYAYWDRQ